MSRPRAWRERRERKAAPEVAASINDGMKCHFDGSWCTQPECRPEWCLSADFDAYLKETPDAR